MTNREIVPSQGPKPPAEIVAAVDGALALWDADLEKTPPAKLRAMIAAAVSAGQSGQIDGLAHQITDPASRREISRAVADMLKNFPKKADAEDLETFSLRLCQDILSLLPSSVALDMAFTAVRRQYNFRPSIAEVFAAVEAQVAICETRAALLRRLPGRVMEAARILKDGGDGAA